MEQVGAARKWRMPCDVRAARGMCDSAQQTFPAPRELWALRPDVRDCDWGRSCTLQLYASRPALLCLHSRRQRCQSDAPFVEKFRTE
eukprot:943833-Prymnesium_polylepis.1